MLAIICRHETWQALWLYTTFPLSTQAASVIPSAAQMKVAVAPGWLGWSLSSYISSGYAIWTHALLISVMSLSRNAASLLRRNNGPQFPFDSCNPPCLVYLKYVLSDCLAALVGLGPFGAWPACPIRQGVVPNPIRLKGSYRPLVSPDPRYDGR